MATTRFPNGITTARVTETLSISKLPDVTKVHRYFNDFDNFIAGDWTVTETQAGATQALIDGDGGLIALTNSAADDDLNSIQLAKETFRLSTSKDFILKIRCKVSDATQSDLVVGLCITDTTPLDVTDGIYFIKSDSSTTVTGTIEKNNTTTSVGTSTMADDTFIDLGLVYESLKGEVRMYANDVLVGSTSTLTNLCDDEDLAITLAVQNGEAVAKTLTIDYVLAEKNR